MLDTNQRTKMNLNQKQLDLLKLLAEVPSSGAIIYGRGPTETVNALAQRRLCSPIGTINVVSMGKIERRACWGITSLGLEELAQERLHAERQGVRS